MTNMKIEWVGLNYGDDRNLIFAKIPVNSVNPLPQCFFWDGAALARYTDSPFIYFQSGLKCREESFHYQVELEAAACLF